MKAQLPIAAMAARVGAPEHAIYSAAYAPRKMRPAIGAQLRAEFGDNFAAQLAKLAAEFLAVGDWPTARLIDEFTRDCAPPEEEPENNQLSLF